MNTWKELYNHYHPDGKVSNKYLRTLFSKVKGNRWDIICTPTHIHVKCVKGKLTLSTKLSPTTTFPKRVDYIRLNTVTFENGFTTSWDKDRRFDYYQTEDGKYHFYRFNADESYNWNTLKDINIISIGTTRGYLLSSDMLTEAESKGICVRIDYKYLFLEDFFLVKKGSIIKSNSYSHSIYNPIAALRSQFTSILGYPECNLTVNTIEEINQECIKLVDNVHGCNKREFGCQYGCTRSCDSNDRKELLKRHAQWMISLKKTYNL